MPQGIGWFCRLLSRTNRANGSLRHTAEIEAESCDAAFSIIRRELGIKPIKVVAAERYLSELVKRQKLEISYREPVFSNDQSDFTF